MPQAPDRCLMLGAYSAGNSASSRLCAGGALHGITAGVGETETRGQGWHNMRREMTGKTPFTLLRAMERATRSFS